MKDIGIDSEALPTGRGSADLDQEQFQRYKKLSESAPARSPTAPSARLVVHLAEPPVASAALPPVLIDHVMVLGAEPVRQMAAALAVVRVVPVRSYNPVVPLECLKVDVELLLAALLVRRPGTVEGAAPQPADLRRRQADEQVRPVVVVVRALAVRDLALLALRVLRFHHRPGRTVHHQHRLLLPAAAVQPDPREVRQMVVVGRVLEDVHPDLVAAAGAVDEQLQAVVALLAMPLADRVGQIDLLPAEPGFERDLPLRNAQPSLPTSSLLIVSAGLDPLMMRNTHSTSTLLPPWMFQWLSVPAMLPVPLFALLFGFSFSSSRIQRVALYTRIVPSIEDGIELSEGKVKN
uniref:Uncharacterized protein n=1 Tax=Anopheles melas TaxID=34690 RepID=A0A182TDS4_9DIPT